MKIFMTVDAAKNKISQLSSYVSLVESFEAETLEEHIIEQYARIGSMKKVVDKVNQMNIPSIKNPIEVDDVREVLTSRGKNELHKTIRTLYLRRIRSSRRN